MANRSPCKGLVIATFACRLHNTARHFGPKIGSPLARCGDGNAATGQDDTGEKMKLGIIFLAFVFGCAATALIRVSPDKADANINEDAATATESEFSLTVAPVEKAAPLLDVVEEPFGETSDGKSVRKFICTNSNGLVLELIDFGATISAMRLPGEDGGESVNVALGCSDMAGYEACTSYFGSTMINNPPNHVLDGSTGIERLIWSSETIKTDDAVGVRFSISSPNADQDSAGEVVVTAEYTLDDQDQLKMVFSATTDAASHINVCNHAYWNIAGAASGSVMSHPLYLASEEVVQFDADSNPTGKLLLTKDNPCFDFTSEKPLADGAEALPKRATGYDHRFVVKRSSPNELALLGSIRDPKSGRKMTVHTTQPGFQLYTSNHFNGQPSSGGFELFGAVCFEAQGGEDTATLLKPGETMTQTTVHKFSYQ